MCESCVIQTEMIQVEALTPSSNRVQILAGVMLKEHFSFFHW